jgi:hypothetical protein
VDIKPMDLTIASIIIGIVGLIIGVITLRNGSRGKTRKMNKLSANERLEKINKILCYQHNFVLNLKGSAFVFMPNGEIIFGAGWVNCEWLELLKNFVSKNEHLKITVASVGDQFYLSDLITGKNINIPVDPQKGMTIEQDGVEKDHLYIFTKY